MFRTFSFVFLALLGYMLAPNILKAQIMFGDTVGLKRETRERAYFYVDTTTMPKWVKSEDWIVLLAPTPEYKYWWFKMAKCQGMSTSSAAFGRHRWFMVNTEIFGNRTPYQIGYSGYSLSDSSATYLAGPKVHDKSVVTHEIVHALMADAGEPDYRHQSPRFDKCDIGGYDT